MRAVWMVVSTLMLSVVLVACTPEKQTNLVADEPSLASLCDEMVPWIESFQEGVDKAGTGDPEGATNHTRFAASSLASTIDIAKRQGFDSKDPAHDWVDSVELAARAFVELSDGGLQSLSDEDAIVVLQRIDQWFVYATDQCLGSGT